VKEILHHSMTNRPRMCVYIDVFPRSCAGKTLPKYAMSFRTVHALCSFDSCYWRSIL